MISKTVALGGIKLISLRRFLKQSNPPKSNKIHHNPPTIHYQRTIQTWNLIFSLSPSRLQIACSKRSVIGLVAPLVDLLGANLIEARCHSSSTPLGIKTAPAVWSRNLVIENVHIDQFGTISMGYQVRKMS